MTHRRYYTDSYTQRFTSRISEIVPVAGGCAAVLEETYFYPTSGGQPHDTGRLGDAAVLDVSIREPDGAILHLVDTPLESGTVAAHLDWPRRYDHMQQHTGQHILSQAFERVAQAPTVGFHLGAERVSIDLGLSAIADRLIADAETLANEIVSSNAAIRAWFPEQAELRALALRKQPEVSGPVRVVAIGDFDVSACGGTHLGASSEVGLIAVLRTERLKRGVRVEFLCGGRARGDYARKHAIVRELSTALTCAPEELAGSVGRLQESLQESRRALAAQQERELDVEAAGRLAATTSRAGLRIVRAAWAERPVEQLKGLALRLTAESGVVALLGVAGARAQLLFGRSENLSVDLKPAFDCALARLGGGRGGGARLLQGAAGPADLEALERVLAEVELLLAGAAA
jgi:alanyl-tRNA synthetase